MDQARTVTATFATPIPGCPSDGSFIGCGALVTCEFSPAGDTDSFRVTVPSNASLWINIAGTVTSYWSIYDPRGNIIISSNNRRVANLSGAGTYTIETHDTRNLEVPYTISVQGVSPQFRCGPDITPNGDPVESELEERGDTDTYQLNNIKAGQVLSINIAGTVTTYWSLYDPEGTEVAASNRLSTVTLPVSGNYTIGVHDTRALQTSYTLSVQSLSN
jgi:hypothetical protein